VATGQSVYVTADAYGDKRFTGTVVRVGERLGRKRIRTDNPAERDDTKVLETLVALDSDAKLPLDLRVTAFISGRER
jgi:HlyD family secretion protein